MVGQTYNFTFQKNENHWTENAGYFSVEYANSPDNTSDWVVLAKFPDTNSPALTMYTLPIVLPNAPSDHAVIRVHYACNGLPFTFYTCSDVKLSK